jgi:hypothetical protein
VEEAKNASGQDWMEQTGYLGLTGLDTLVTPRLVGQIR